MANARKEDNMEIMATVKKIVSAGKAGAGKSSTQRKEIMATMLSPNTSEDITERDRDSPTYAKAN